MEKKACTRIGVIADTHMNRPNKAFLGLQEGLFSDVSVVLHAGDIGNPDILDIFYGKDVFAVSGNCDSHEVVSHFPISRIVTAEASRIGLIHGWGIRGSVMTRAREYFQGVDVVVFGHTHIPVCVELNGVLMFNPGSFLKNRHAPWPGTVGILTVFQDGSVKGEVFPVPV